MLAAIKDLIASKKFVAAVIASLVWILGKVGWNVDSETLSGALVPFLTFIVAQGVSDHGKGAAQAAAPAPTPATSPATVAA